MKTNFLVILTIKALIFFYTIVAYEIYSIVGWAFDIEAKLPILEECERPIFHILYGLFFLVKAAYLTSLLFKEIEDFRFSEELEAEKYICRVDP